MIKKVRTPNTLCHRGYITITCLHKSAGWSVRTNQNHSTKNKINTSGGTGEFDMMAETILINEDILVTH
jgi:hypothetical protein